MSYRLPWRKPPTWAVTLNTMLAQVLANQEIQMAAIDDLAAAVAKEDTVIQSAITLIQGIPALIAAAGVDPVKLAALQTDITAQTAALSAAVAANTPAAPAPAPAAAPAATPAP